MLLTKFLFPIVVLTLVLLVLISTTENDSIAGREIDFMNGVSFVAPPNEFNENPFGPVRGINADWVAIMPYAFTTENSPEVVFDNERQWWGERTTGTIKTIAYAKSIGLKIMLKPHVWVRGQGWTGDFTIEGENNWLKWENSYEKYILTHAELADSMNVEALCIGLEFKHVVKERPEFWIDLIGRVRNIYHGKICYAANWDNYQNIPFWDKVDFIGINAYFPLSQETTPEHQELISAWSNIKEMLSNFSKTHGKPIVFTEYGYRSMDKAAGNQWELEHHRK